MMVRAASDNAETLLTTPQKMADELRTTTDGLAKLHVLIVSSDDGLAMGTDALAAAIREKGGKVEVRHLTTDHSYSDSRLALQAAVITWLEALPGAK
jgi:hypothetical protein